MVILAMKSRAPELEFELVPLKTRGDKLLDVSLAGFGGKGAFVTEFHKALLDGAIDIAVHSAKDVPWQLPGGLELWASLERGDARDVLLVKKGRDLATMKVVGTASPRRELQIRELFPVQCRLLRGNVPTRIEKLKKGDYDGILLAAAGLDRLGLTRDEGLDYRYFTADEMIPAPGQGIIVVEGRKEDPLRELFAEICDRKSFMELEVERFLLRKLRAGCHEPTGAFSRITGEKIVIRLLTQQDGRTRRGKLEGPVGERFSLAERLIDEVSGCGGESAGCAGEVQSFGRKSAECAGEVKS